MPMDMWLYEYARIVFEARWNLYKTGVYTKPSRPKMPTKMTCQSTRYILSCKTGPMSPLYYASPGTPNDHLKEFGEFLYLNTEQEI